MSIDPRRAKELFVAALDLTDAQAREAFLDRECGDAAELRQRLAALLKAHEEPVSALSQPLAGAKPDADPVETGHYANSAEQPGTLVAGRYKLLEQIGEGGMGTVWVAEQTQPIRRKVALKLIKPGMDSKTVLSRFEAERQALALMDHPNIAKVLDGGATESGRPYFVMEYVKGVPFTRYCDEARLSIAERLALFVPICQAVQHAHQKGIIHRDLKPSNILACLYDGKPVPKVIDFGLAKAMHQPLTEHTLHTAHGAMMGTPLYMSPEQAELNNLDVDTRTDIYALGVILYELLTGTTPLEKQRFKEAAWQEMLRVIKEEEPPRPSARLSGSGSLPSLAAQRQLEPVKLAMLVRGELDWIVMKCLEKERSRRYDTANGLARDIERYLADEVVEARSPSRSYRLRKFARKNRVALTTAAAFAGLLIAAVVVSSWLAVIASRAEALADERRREADANLETANWARMETIGEKVKSDIKAVSLQIDLDLAELKTDRRIGLLRLARPLKDRSDPFPFSLRIIPIDQDVEILDPERKWWSYNDFPEYFALREFVTAAVLATGQDYAPLLPPITHDGLRILSSVLSSTGDRLLTLGTDKTSRLWDSFTGRQVAILRRADEKVIEVGLSPDGATAFTHSLDGVVRLWETKDGRFRAETEPRPGRIKFEIFGSSDPYEEALQSAWGVTRLSNDRLMTSSVVVQNISVRSHAGPVELWDAKSGRFVARLKLPNPDRSSFGFLGIGRWIEWHDPSDREMPRVFSAENGQLIAILKCDEKYGFSHLAPILSPSGRTAATFSSAEFQRWYVHLWDTTSWQSSSITGPIKCYAATWSDPTFQLIADDLFAIDQMMNGGLGFFRPGTATPIAELPFKPTLFQADRFVLHPGQLFDARTWRRLQPPKGRKYHPELARFAPDGRFFVEDWGLEGAFIDTATDKTFEYSAYYQPRLGWVKAVWGEYGARLSRLPPSDRLEIPPDLLELWAQVAVRGQLDDEGAFVKWKEDTWEKKRQELAAKPAPYPDFPFPGHVATDRLHWLRQEYTNASDADKPRLARQLLDRAEATGDRAEAIRWRAILTPKPAPTSGAKDEP